MKIVDPSYEILTNLDGKEILKLLEKAGRTCYKSEEKITNESALEFIKKLVKRGHEAMIEHFNVTVRFVCNRGFTHELVRHRLASFAQESTRYCNYGKQNEITVIRPPNWDEWDEGSQEQWENAMNDDEDRYMSLIERGRKPQEARGVLPIDVKTEIIITANIREWRHIFKLRTANTAHPSMQQLMRPLLEEFKNKIPILYDNISY